MISLNPYYLQINKNLNVHNTATSKIGFKSEHLYDVKIYDRGKLVPARITQLDVDKDQKVVTEIVENWKYTRYGKKIALPFNNKNVVIGDNKFLYYALESSDPIITDEQSSNKIKGLALCINKNSEELRVSYIQVSPDAICNVNDKNKRTYKNVGKMLMYGIIKQAHKEKLPRIKLNSSKKGFYEKLGFQLEEPISVHSEMILNRDDYKSSLNKIEKDFGLKLTA